MDAFHENIAPNGGTMRTQLNTSRTNETVTGRSNPVMLEQIILQQSNNVRSIGTSMDASKA